MVVICLIRGRGRLIKTDDEGNEYVEFDCEEWDDGKLYRFKEVHKYLKGGRIDQLSTRTLYRLGDDIPEWRHPQSLFEIWPMGNHCGM